MMVTDVIDAYLTRQRSLGMRFESAGGLLHRKRQLIDTLPARERRVEYGRHGRFGEHDVC